MPLTTGRVVPQAQRRPRARLYHRVEGCTIVGATDMALQVMVGGRPTWVPRSIVRGVRKVEGESGKDEISVPLWFAQAEHWV